MLQFIDPERLGTKEDPRGGVQVDRRGGEWDGNLRDWVGWWMEVECKGVMENDGGSFQSQVDT